MSLYIRKAVPDDIPAIEQIFDAARRYMAEHGNPHQWVGGYPQREVIAADVQAGYCHICALADGSVAGVFSFIPGPDHTYSRIDGGQWLNNEPYAVVHRVASAGKVGGVARACLDWCFAHCPNIRIDTHADNLPMQRAVEDYGFVRCGVIYTHNGTPRIAYQLRKAGSAGRTDTAL